MLLTPAAYRLRSARAHFVRRPVGLASALTCFGVEFITIVIPAKAGIRCHRKIRYALKDGFQPSLE